MRVELAKQLRRVRTWVALGAVALLPIIATIATRLSTEEGDAGAGTLYAVSEASAINNALAALAFMSPFFLVIVVALFAGDTVAGEASWGTLRYLLVRPVSRPRLLARKLVAAGILSLLATSVVVVAALAAGAIAFGWKPLSLPVFGSTSIGEGMARLAVATGYVAWNMAAVLAVAFMLSTMTDVAFGAIGGAIGLAIASQILDAIPALGDVRLWLPTHYLSAWAALFIPLLDGTEMIRGAVQQAVYAVLFCSVAWWWFARKDILS